MTRKTQQKKIPRQSKAERIKEKIKNSPMANAMTKAMLKSEDYTPDDVQKFLASALESKTIDDFQQAGEDRIKTRRQYGRSNSTRSDMVENLFISQPSWYDRIIPGYDMILCGVLFQPPFVSLRADEVNFSIIHVRDRQVMYQILHRDDLLQMGSTITKDSSAMPYTDTNYWIHIITDHVHEILVPLTRRNEKGGFINPLLRRKTDPNPNEDFIPSERLIAVNLLDFVITYRGSDNDLNIHDPYPWHMDHRTFFKFNESISDKDLVSQKDLQE